MRTIQDVYQRYHIMANLQQHMLRVTGVAQQILSVLPVHKINESDRHDVLLAALLHDMGNILKFDLLKYPKFLEPEGLAHWQKVQAEFQKKYGPDEHTAVLQILDELGVSLRVQELVEAVGFLVAVENQQSNDMARKVAAYADMRVTPHGVVSLEERLRDLCERYGAKFPSAESQRQREVFEKALRGIEGQLFRNLSLRPDQITEVSTLPLTDDFLQISV
jgi:5'-deoxynucleotidase YfbR-like HD superfamily hydrolase